MDMSRSHRLEHLRDLLPDARLDGPPKLLLFARSGFAGDLRSHAEQRADVELIDLARLYRGD